MGEGVVEASTLPAAKIRTLAAAAGISGEGPAGILNRNNSRVPAARPTLRRLNSRMIVRRGAVPAARRT